MSKTSEDKIDHNRRRANVSRRTYRATIAWYNPPAEPVQQPRCPLSRNLRRRTFLGSRPPSSPTLVQTNSLRMPGYQRNSP